MIKLKDLLLEGPAMTPQEKKRTISRLHKFDEPGLVNMLRVAGDAANRGNARADDLAHIYRDELNRRKGVKEGGPGSGRPRTGSAPKLQEPWQGPAKPVKHKSKLSRKSRSKESDPTARQVRSTKGKHAPKLKQFGETEDRLDEAPSEAVIAGALDAIRSEVRHKDPDIQRWLYPHLRKIDNALRKFKRSGS